MRRVSVILLCGVLVGCRGPRGPQGPQGAQGPAGPTGLIGPASTSTSEFNGTIPSNGIVVIGSITSKTTVSVYYAFASLPTVFMELGTPISGSSSNTPFCGVSYDLGAVYFYNTPPGALYKILISKPLSAPMPSGQFGDRLLW